LLFPDWSNCNVPEDLACPLGNFLFCREQQAQTKRGLFGPPKLRLDGAACFAWADFGCHAWLPNLLCTD
jgi:hypothetical protein